MPMLCQIALVAGEAAQTDTRPRTRVLPRIHAPSDTTELRPPRLCAAHNNNNSNDNQTAL